MQFTPEQAFDWRDWLLLTSIPLVQIGDDDQPLVFGSGAMIDYEGRRFVVTAEHVVTLNSKGWAIVVQQHADGRLEYYRPRAFVHVGEGRRSDGSHRLLDLCVAQVAPNLETWYENRTPRGLFDKRPHHVFEASRFMPPEPKQVYGFSGRVRTERHSPGTFASEMTVFPGLSYRQSEKEEHIFSLPVPHPGHDAFRGSSGSPICDFSRNLVGIVVRGDIPTNTVRAVDIRYVLPALHALSAD
jgi:V8-like Glu-specific endopeptidase